MQLAQILQINNISTDEFKAAIAALKAKGQSNQGNLGWVYKAPLPQWDLSKGLDLKGVKYIELRCNTFG